jgi:hypothetical protein
MAKWPKEKQIFANQLQSRKTANKQSGLSGKDRAYVKQLTNSAITFRLKEIMGCEECGVFGPHYMFDLDHINPKEKHTLSSKAAVPRGMNQDNARTETLKCRVLCKNCHAKRTYEEHHYRNDSNMRSVEREHLKAEITPELEQYLCLLVSDMMALRNKRKS